MTFVPVMISVWGAVIIFFLAVKIYVSRVARDEGDQVLLSDSSNSLKVEQDAIAARVNKLAPLQRVSLILVGVMTLVVVGYYVFDIVHQFSY